MKLSSLIGSAIVALSAAALPAAAGAQAATGTYGGHTYSYYSDNVTFEVAQAAATTAGGYLANVTSQGEQDYLHSLTSGIAWIGGTDAGHEGTWTWIGGPEAGKSFYSVAGNPVNINYSFWNGGEPNNFTGYNAAGENNLVINWAGDGRWNDLDDLKLGSPNNPVGYIVEFGGGAVPEPTTWAMMLLGFGVVGFAMRRRVRTNAGAVAA